MILSVAKISFGKPFFYESSYFTLLEHLEAKKWENFQGERPTFSRWKRIFFA
jgi:hypothetical protein